MYLKLLTFFLSLVFSASAIAELKLQSAQGGIFQHPSNVELNEGERYFGRSTERLYETSQIPAKLGTKFGIRYQVNGKAAEKNIVSYLYLTPGVEHPDESIHHKYVETVELKADAKHHVAAFQFTDEYELVEGTWEIFVFVDDRLLVRKKFNVSTGAQPSIENQSTSDLLQYRVISPSR
jgi:hypothetical protein